MGWGSLEVTKPQSLSQFPPVNCTAFGDHRRKWYMHMCMHTNTSHTHTPEKDVVRLLTVWALEKNLSF